LGKKFGEGMVQENLANGVQYLRDVNEGKMAMNAPPIQEAEAPAVEQPSYSDLLDRQSELAESRSVEPEGMTR
jgi:hypothetical protein